MLTTLRVGAWVLLALLGGILGLSLAGNLLVVTAICTDRHLRKRSNSLYASLSCADLLLSAMVMSLSLGTELHLGRWPFPRAWCKVYLSLDVMGCTASILNLVAIAIDRFMHVSDPFRYERVMRGGTFVLLIGLVWSLSALVSFLPIYLEWHANEPVNPMNIHRNHSNQPEFFCTLDLNPQYAVISSFVSFFLPCLLLVFLYLRLYLIATRHMRSLPPVNVPSTENSPTPHAKSLLQLPLTPEMGSKKELSVPGAVGPQLLTRMSSSSKDHKAAVTLGIIVGTFLLCWTPFFACNCLNPFCGCIPEIVMKLFTWLGYANSSLNPIIYSLFNLEFRYAFQRILCRRFFVRSASAQPNGGGGRWRWFVHPRMSATGEMASTIGAVGTLHHATSWSRISVHHHRRASMTPLHRSNCHALHLSVRDKTKTHPVLARNNNLSSRATLQHSPALSMSRSSLEIGTEFVIDRPMQRIGWKRSSDVFVSPNLKKRYSRLSSFQARRLSERVSLRHCNLDVSKNVSTIALPRQQE